MSLPRRQHQELAAATEVLAERAILSLSISSGRTDVTAHGGIALNATESTVVGQPLSELSIRSEN